MIRFLIKKSFFDTWDNLFSLILINLGFIFCLGITALIAFTTRASPGAVTILLTIPGIFLSHIYAGTISILLHKFSEFKSFSFALVKNGFLKTWKASLILASINSLMIIIFTFGFPFYLSMGNIIGIVGAGIIFWFSLFWFLSCQYFYPVLFKLEGGIYLSLKKSILLTIDNPLFSIFIFLHSAVVLMLSMITVLIMPGLSAILLLHQDAVKLRLYKYDWLEKNPGENRNKIPWDLLIQDDRDQLGTRSLKGMIFPWKN
ncbi:MAG: hypothetical protein JEZ04_07770 [Spirochaetales bacterium]|nr:hypothetical protein [Spirochaetales bacterium]